MFNTTLVLGVRQTAQVYWVMAPVLISVFYLLLTAVLVAECLAGGGVRQHWDYLSFVLRMGDAMIIIGFYKWFSSKKEGGE